MRAPVCAKPRQQGVGQRHHAIDPALPAPDVEERRARIGEQVAEDALARVDEPTDSDVVGGWIARFLGVGQSAR